MSLLDNLTSSLNRGVEGVGRKADAVRINAQINEVNKQRQAYAAQLGAALYEITKSNPEFFTGCEPLYESIHRLDMEREQLMQQLKQLEEMAHASVGLIKRPCPQCSAQISDADMFCPGCGAEVVKLADVTPRESSQTGLTCPNCHSSINADDVFCMSCGTKLEAAVPQENASSFGHEQAAVGPDTSVPPITAYDLESPVASYQDPVVSQAPEVDSFQSSSDLSDISGSQGGLE